MRQEENCIFCKIVKGGAQAIKVDEDELTLTFMDINPASAGHTLVISREHFENLLQIDAPTLTAVTLTTQRIALAVQQALQPDGIRIGQFNGAAAGQTVFHYHVHVVPMRLGQRTGAHGHGPGNLDEIREIAQRIRTALQG
jgi:histidine triad (HIT) family protein